MRWLVSPAAVLEPLELSPAGSTRHGLLARLAHSPCCHFISGWGVHEQKETPGRISRWVQDSSAAEHTLPPHVPVHQVAALWCAAKGQRVCSMSHCSPSSQKDPSIPAVVSHGPALPLLHVLQANSVPWGDRWVALRLAK